MEYKLDFLIATSAQIESALCERIKEIRLAKNISQAQLAKDSGVTRKTIERLESGEGVSLDTFLRVLIALGVQKGLQNLLPDMSVRPVDRVRMQGKERKRSFPIRQHKHKNKKWSWGDEGVNL